jgi:hypothetical protein
MIDPTMTTLIDYLMKLRGESGNPMMPPQAPSNPIEQIIQMAQQANPQMAGSLNPMSNIQQRIQMLNEASSEPQAPTQQAAPQEQDQYVAPARVKQMSDGSIKRWDSYQDAWVAMKPEELNQYVKSGGVVGK